MKNPLGKKLKYLIPILVTFAGFDLHAEEKPIFFYGETIKKVAVGIDAPWSSMVSRKQVTKLGYTPASIAQIEVFNRTDAKCDMQCSDKIKTSGHVTYDSRVACHKSCMRSEGWALIQVEEDAK